MMTTMISSIDECFCIFINISMTINCFVLLLLFWITIVANFCVSELCVCVLLIS